MFRQNYTFFDQNVEQHTNIVNLAVSMSDPRDLPAQISPSERKIRAEKDAESRNGKVMMDVELD